MYTYIARTYCGCFNMVIVMIQVLLLLLFVLMCVAAILVWTKVLLALLGLDIYSKDSDKFKDTKESKASMLSYDDLKTMCIKPPKFSQ